MIISVIMESDRFHDHFNTHSSIVPTPLYVISDLTTPSSSLVVQLGSSAAYRVGQAVGLQWRLWRGGLLGAPEQRCSAGWGEKEQQEATFFHLSHHVPQTHASSSPATPLHGDQWAGPHQLQQPDSSCPNWRDQRGAFLQRTFTGKKGGGRALCYGIIQYNMIIQSHIMKHGIYHNVSP